MGNKEAKPVSISYEDAESRVSLQELKRLKEAFRRTCPSNQMNFALFYQEIMGLGVPHDIAEQIFCAFGGGKPLSFKDLLCGLVLFTRAREKDEERYKFLFGLYADDDLTIHKHKMDEKILKTDGEIPESVSELFEKEDKVSYDEFKRWLKNYPEFTSLSYWMLIEKCALVLTEKSELPNFYQTLAGVTHLSEQEVMALEHKYWALKKSSLSGKFDIDLFKKLLSPPLPQTLSTSLFHVFDENGDGHIDFKEYVCGISACCRGPNEERQKSCFRVFDRDHDGYLSKSELVGAIESSFHILQQGQHDTSTAELLQLDPYQMAAEIIQSHNADKEKGLTKEEYLLWTQQSDVPKSFAYILSEVCHVILGLKPCKRSEEERIVNGWLLREQKRGYQKGQIWYLVSDYWWKKWISYVNDVQYETIEMDEYNVIHTALPHERRTTNHNTDHPPRPTAIENNHLVTHHSKKAIKIQRYPTLTNEGGMIKRDLEERKDYHLVPSALWDALSSWYSGGPALPRLVIDNAMDEGGDGDFCIELYPLHVNLYKHQSTQSSAPAPTVGGMTAGLANMALQATGFTSSTVKRVLTNTACFSQRHTLSQVIDFLAGRLMVCRDDLRLWRYNSENDMELLEGDDKVLTELNIDNQSSLLMEVRNRDQTWPEEMLQVMRNPNQTKKPGAATDSKVEPGLTGLSNLGNTCFMNSAVQCVSNTEPLTKYFRQGYHLFELNKTNILGMKGQLAKVYGQLVKDMWNGTNKSLPPLQLRWMLAKYAPQFNGYQQHDSQELLSFLLDGLHEDLNRVREKTYCELKDSDGRPDEVVAREAWENHLMSNKSIIVDLFHGQLKSAVKCKHCGNKSVRFDPFTYLSLPLPMECSVTVEIILLRLDGSIPQKYGFRFNSDEKYLSLRTKLSELSEIHQDNLLLTELVASTVKIFPADTQKVKRNMVGSLYVYETAVPVHTEPPAEDPAPTETPAPQSNGGVVNNHIHSTIERNKFNSTSSSNTSNSNGGITQLNTERDPPKGSLVILHRKTERREHYFHAAQQCVYSLFGVPLIYQITENTTNKDLYLFVWKMVKRCVTGNPGTEMRNHAQDCDGSLGNEYPFVLRLTKSNGIVCAKCKYYKFCSGCKIDHTDDPFTFTTDYLVIDWDPTSLHLRYQSSQEYELTEHISVKQCRADDSNIDLHDCLEAFTKEEELTEPYHCKKCKQHRVASKKLEIWRLPPVLIIHLKRFHFVNGRWIKSVKGVEFPVTDFDPELYLSSRSSVLENDPTTPITTPDGSFNPSYSSPTSESPTAPHYPTHPRVKTFSTTSFDSLDYTNTKYDLNTVSCHKGAMGGGHYVAYGKNTNGKWYEYNDSMVKEVDVSQIDKHSSYILLYKRRNYQFERLMPKVEDKIPDQFNLDDEFQRDYKKSITSVCCIQ